MDTSKDITTINSALKSGGFSFFVLKTERLTSALYLVTSLLSDNEPLKWKLRENALQVLTDIKQVSTEEFANGDQTFVFYKNIDLDAFRRDVDDILSLLAVSLNSGTVSTMNLALLKSEYETLAQNISSTIDRSMQAFVLSGYNSHDPLPLTESKNVSLSQISDSRLLDNLPTSSAGRSAEDKRHAPSRSVTAISEDNESVTKNERQDKIKTFLKDKGWVSIKDISTILPECSVKTVQRDLSVLVDRGVLKKKGDRRWSRYALVV